MFKIKNGKVVSDEIQVQYFATKKTSGKRKTNDYLVIHYTAGMNYNSDVRTLSTGTPQASAHFVIAADGRVTQIGGLEDCLWHAGVSKWDGIYGLNQHSIGIEVVCPGYLTRDADGTYRTWTKAKYTGQVVEAYHPNDTAKTGPKYWAAFTEEQIKVLIELGSLLFNHFNMKEVVGHDMISPGRKSDPGPCMPNNVYGMIMGRKDAKSESSGEMQYNPNIDKSLMFSYVIDGVPDNDTLNLRSSANGGDNVIGKIRNGTMFNRFTVTGEWWYIITENGKLGWIHSNFTKRSR